MENSTMRPRGLGSLLRKGALALAIVAAAGAVAVAPATAQEWHHDGGRGHDWHGHERHEWREHHRAYGYGYVAPGYYYAPPPVVYGAPEPPAVLNFSFGIR